jgi:toxin HigB-1
VRGYTKHVIRSFRHKGLKLLYEKGERRRVHADFVDKIERILARLDQASEPENMDLPGYRLHPLKGDLARFWSVTVSGNWRIVFRFEGGHACDVDLIDYH